jgi:hypothetical protein
MKTKPHPGGRSGLVIVELRMAPDPSFLLTGPHKVEFAQQFRARGLCWTSGERRISQDHIVETSVALARKIPASRIPFRSITGNSGPVEWELRTHSIRGRVHSTMGFTAVTPSYTGFA